VWWHCSRPWRGEDPNDRHRGKSAAASVVSGFFALGRVASPATGGRTHPWRSLVYARVGRGILRTGVGTLTPILTSAQVPSVPKGTNRAFAECGLDTGIAAVEGPTAPIEVGAGAC
jgi:hypothetical protein